MWIKKLIPTNHHDIWVLLNSDHVIAITLDGNVIKIRTINSELPFITPLGVDPKEIVLDIWEQLNPEEFEGEEEQDDEC